MYQAAIDSFRVYAEQVNADLIISDELHYPLKINEPKYAASPAWSEKMRIGDLLQDYDRVLYLDSDIVVKPDARDVFAEYSEMDTVYMLDEGMIVDRHLEVEGIFEVLGPLPDWIKVGDKWCYYNVGVILISKQCPLYEYARVEELQQICNEIPFYEQTYFNYLIQKHQLKHQSLSKDFNRMNIFGFNNYKNADFIHYAGRGYGRNGRKRELGFVRDYCEFFANELSKDKVAQFKNQSWEFYLQRVFKKYHYLPKSLLRLMCSLFQSKELLEFPR